MSASASASNALISRGEDSKLRYVIPVKAGIQHKRTKCSQDFTLQLSV
jgi:hypothetical protein